MDFIAIGTVIVLFIGIFVFPGTSVKRAEQKLIKMFSPQVSQSVVIDIKELKNKIVKNNT